MRRKRTDKKCIDCEKLLSRLDAIRCHGCKVKDRAANAKGRRIGVYCSVCKKELSTKKNTTGLCILCYKKSDFNVPWNKGIKMPYQAWNKGKFLIEDPIKRKQMGLSKRREQYYKREAKWHIADRIRTLIRNSIKCKTSNRKKDTKTEVLLGCEVKKFIIYLEMRFEEGMTWQNYGNGHGKWNIDHIKPVSSFNLEDIEEQKKCFNFMNCQPMWAIDNIKKGNKILTATVTYR